MGFIGGLIALSLSDEYANISIIKPNETLPTIVNMETNTIYIAWILIFAFEFIFVITALPICKPGEHL
jgi:hypothetical protein